MDAEQRTSADPWQEGKCRVPMWMGGGPAGFCDETAYGPQLPDGVRWFPGDYRQPYCSGPCCPKHGGPKLGEPIVFKDGYTPEGRPMYCAVMPGFVNIQESPCAFHANSVRAIAELLVAVENAERTTP